MQTLDLMGPVPLTWAPKSTFGRSSALRRNAPSHTYLDGVYYVLLCEYSAAEAVVVPENLLGVGVTGEVVSTQQPSEVSV